MFREVRFSGYRGFSSFSLGPLTRVNLLVGRNNSGKTSLLEGLHFLASGGDPYVLSRSISARGEYLLGERLLDVTHLFNGHVAEHGCRLRIEGNNGLRPVEVESVALAGLEQADLFSESRSRTDFLGHQVEGTPTIGLRITGSLVDESPQTLLLADTGVFIVDPERRGRRVPYEQGASAPPRVRMISPESTAPRLLARYWDQVLSERREGEVIKAMRILEADIDDIVFQTADTGGSRYSASRGGVLLGFKNQPKRLPLGSLGDGMRRLLALSITLIDARGGTLMVDEVDTGFHYSVMADMWKLIVTTARNADIQVFATTHSLDCIRGLSLLCQREPDLMGEVSIHKIERNLDRSISFSAEQAITAVEQDIEVR